MREKLDKKWQAIMDQLDEEHPEIQTNHFKYLYVGHREFIYDINNETSEDTFIEGLEPEPEEDNSEEEAAIRELGEQMFKEFKGRDLQIMKLRYEEGWSFADIGRKFGMSRQLVFYHHKKNIEHLQNKFLT
jgi:RNA polymerase sigma factor (sigma-70 family)